MSLAKKQFSINERKVPDEFRSNFLPRKLPNLFLLYEQMIYSCFSQLSSDYMGGFWDYVELDNGGFYMSLRSDKTYRVSVDGNYFDGELTANAASIVVNLFVFCHLANKFQDDESLSDFYYALLHHSSNHSEASQILSAID